MKLPAGAIVWVSALDEPSYVNVDSTDISSASLYVNTPLADAPSKLKTKRKIAPGNHFLTEIPGNPGDNCKNNLILKMECVHYIIKIIHKISEFGVDLYRN